MNTQENSNRTGDDLPSKVSATSELAAALRKSILDGEFAVGDSLPSERELMARYDVSRSTVREALRVLHGHGLIEVRRGRFGGSYISNPPTELVVQSLDMFIKGHDIRLVDLVLAREAIECAAAAQAAVCRTDEHLEALRQRCVSCETTLFDVAGFVQANLDWHLALVEASGNPLFVAFMNSISPAIHTATDRAEFDLRIRKSVVGIHWQIFRAIHDRDPDAARRRMARHLLAYGDKLKSIDFETPAA